MPRISTDNYDTVASWNGSQDLFVVEQPDGTKVATPEQIKQYVLGNSIDDIYSVMGQMGAKNLIPYPYYRESGYSSNGMTTTYDSDGVLTINKEAGSSTAYFSFIVNDQDYCFKPNTEYKLLFELENANQLTIYLKYGDSDIVLINKKSTGKYVANFTTPQTLQGRENLAMNAAASDTETNAKVKVMIMLASDTDDTYQPYAKTNRQLTDELSEKVNSVDVKGLAEAGDFEATGEVKDGHGNVLNNLSQAVTGLQSLIDFVHDLPPDASTTPSNIPTGIRVHFNIASQRAGYPMGDVLYVSIKIENTRCVQILFKCNTGNSIMLRTSLSVSTWSNWTTISQS